MTRTVTDCDRCEAKDVDAIRLVFPIAQDLDSCGDVDVDYEDVDLCPACFGKAIGKLLTQKSLLRNYTFNRELVNFLKSETATTPHLEYVRGGKTS